MREAWAGIVLCGAALAACTTNPETGKQEVDTVAVLQILSLAGSLATIAADTGAPSLEELAAGGAEEGIARFCLLDSWDKNTVRQQLDERDPSLRPYLVERYGGPDGDVCTED